MPTIPAQSETSGVPPVSMPTVVPVSSSIAPVAPRHSEQHAKHMQKYKRLLHQWTADPSMFPEHKVFELLYALHLGHILWDDLPPDFGNRYDLPHMRDYGVDTVSWNYDQTSQVKFYGDRSVVRWSDYTNYATYSKTLLNIPDMHLATTPVARLDSLVSRAVVKDGVTVHRRTLKELLEEALEGVVPGTASGSASGSASPAVVPSDATAGMPVAMEPRDYQRRAYETIVTSHKPYLRLQLPCGTGKSYIMLYTMLESLKQDASGTFCVFCPWLDLAMQLRALFARWMNVLFLGDGQRQQTRPEEPFQVVVCVTPSVCHVPDHVYTMKFYDEAHRVETIAGKHRRQLDAVRCEKTVLFSATFRDQRGLDFDYPVRQAIDDGHISDYVVHLEYLTTGDRRAALLRMVAENATWYPMFIYFNRTETCEEFNAGLRARGVRSDVLVGTDESLKRTRVKQDLEEGRLSVLCLCGCFNEGISIDPIQTVVFGDLRHSDINKVQCAMRANRKHPTKPYYRVVLPITRADLEDEDGDLRKLVQSFAQRDPLFRDTLRPKDGLERRGTSRVCVRVGRDQDGTPANDAELLCEEVYLRCGEMVRRRDEAEKLQMLREYCEAHNKTPPQKTEAPDGFRLGQWFNTQKTTIATNTDDIYTKLAAVHPAVRKELDRFMAASAGNDQIRIPQIDQYTIEFENNTLLLTPKIRHLTNMDVMSMSFSYSKIVRSTIRMKGQPTTVVSNGQTSYRSLLIDVFASMSQPLSTRFKVVADNLHGANGFQWCEKLGVSLPPKSATDILREVVRLVHENQYSLHLVIELQSGERVKIAV